ncbi:hypothetical protein HOD75_04465 [archaeon]|nr:hypothetical protein [archaeon]MBT4242118.1 hypothetical protein [archaeon]MBT4417806.1 hypothetical protein [archaeon]
MANKPKFKRTDFSKFSKLGVRRKKKQVYRKAKGLDNKIRLNMKGHVKKVKVGFKNEVAKRHLVDDKALVNVKNIEEIKNLKKDEIGVVAKLGAKKKKEIAEFALKEKIRLYNLNPKTFLGKLEKKLKDKKETSVKKMKNKKSRDAKAKKEQEKKEKAEEKKGKESVEDKVEGKGSSELKNNSESMTNADSNKSVKKSEKDSESNESKVKDTNNKPAEAKKDESK